MKPNILVIMSDQFRHDAVECNGNPVIKTLNMNALAASGVNFSHSFTPNPVCVPARISFTTGCYAHKAAAGEKGNKGVIQPGFPKLGEELVKRGYETYSVGKLHYLPYRKPGEPRTVHGLQHVELAESGRILGKYDKLGQLEGVEDYHDYLKTVGWGGYTRGHGLGNNDIYPASSPIPEEHYVDSWVANGAISYMKKHVQEQPDKPFFMWASFPKPHSVYDPPRPYDALYDPREMPDPVGDIGMIRERGLDLLYSEHINYIWDLLSPEAKKVIKAYYYGLISLQDKLIGNMLRFLDEQGLRDNTIVIFTSDHGDLMGDFGLYFKRCFYNGSVKVPLMISWPGHIPAGTTSDELVGLEDLMPTLMSLIGEPLEQAVDGKDLSPVLLEQKPVREYYVSQSETSGMKMSYMITNKTWRYMYHVYGGVEELYNEVEDPQELHNLAHSTDSGVQDLKEQMRVELLKWIISNEDHNMLEHGDLLRVEKLEDLPLPKRHYLFGRRFY
ncbi:sulfatase family protein [Paenibacillus cremeus]|uniref:Sulfatase-like hydrolase/transferase n=1 Tax=Paenibacillus cremeus TaxID=2163881 RepID=A0A559KBE6_9BACL|nr:sulfatase-like hydrolase/transferase [Paenibacillus cremeus]TVY09458.1 sulfatase-like hydrolase/transferase [Paenibacillus cremeus]